MTVDNRFHVIARINDTEENSKYLGISSIF